MTPHEIILGSIIATDDFVRPDPDDIIEALRKAGFVIVPRDATTPMRCAADAARDVARNPLTDAEVYSAMIQAAARP